MIKKGLGKGLSALLSIYDEENEIEESAQENKTAQAENKYTAPKTETNNGIEEVDISLIDTNPGQPRKVFDKEALTELSESIKVHGVIQPIIVNRTGNRFVIIAGERRFRASKLAGLRKIPAIIKNYTDKQVQEIALIENLQREDLNAIEAAKGIKKLIDAYDLTQETVADRIGKSRPAVANLLRLLSLHPEIIKLIEENKLSAGHARCLITIPDVEIQLKLANLASNGKMSVRELEKAVKNILNPKPEVKKEKIEQSLELKELISTMQRKFATKVSAIGNDRKGRIYIDYYSRDDLDRIEELLSKLN